jgi:hypothetical protein
MLILVKATIIVDPAVFLLHEEVRFMIRKPEFCVGWSHMSSGFEIS